MRDLRWWSVSSVAWLLVLYGIERLAWKLGLGPALFPVAAVSLGIVAFSPWLQQRRRQCLTGASLLFLTAKSLLGYEILGAASLETLLELLAVVTTVWLGCEFGQRLAEFHEASTSLMVQHLQDDSTAFEQGQSQIYQEIRRARRHRRPAALLTVSLDPSEVEAKSDRLMLEVQRENVARYAMARLGEILDRQLHGYGIITRRDGHFVTFLPETRTEDAAELSRRLSKVAENELGLQLRTGFATFPDEEVTFANLLERAEREMGVQRASATDPDDDPEGWVVRVP